MVSTSAEFLVKEMEPFQAKHELILKRAAYKMQNRAISVTYNAWIHFVNRIKHERKLLQRIFNQLSNRLANKGMVTWKAYDSIWRF